MEMQIEKMLEGDRKSLEIFYETYAPKLTRYVKRHLSEKEDIDAIVHDILLEAIDSLPLFEGKCSLQTWIYTIAHHAVVDTYRKNKIKAVLLSQMPFLELVSQEIYDPEFQYEKNRIRDAIERTFRSMSAKYRDILRLHYEERKSIKEIALLLNLSPKATESLLFRARQQFKNTYEKG